MLIEELLARVRENPNDIAARLVLADAWIERGDVRGELIQVQYALLTAEGAQRMHLLGREKSICRKLGWRGGPIVRHARLGFVERLAINAARPHESTLPALEKILGSEEGMFLRALTIIVPWFADRPYVHDLALELGRRRLNLSQLTRLEIGDAFRDDPADRNEPEETRTDNLSAMLDLFSSMKEIRIDLGTCLPMLPPTFSSEHVRDFEWVSPCLLPEILRPITGWNLPALEHFVLWTGATMTKQALEEKNDARISLTPDDLEPVMVWLDEKTKLRTTGFAHHGGDLRALVRRMTKHAFFSRIDTLDLSHGWIGPEAADELTKAPQNIRRLVIAGCEITPGTMRILERFELVGTPCEDEVRFRLLLREG